MKNGYLREVAVLPFTTIQRQRVEALTLVYHLEKDPQPHTAIGIAHWIVTGEKS